MIKLSITQQQHLLRAMRHDAQGWTINPGYNNVSLRTLVSLETKGLLWLYSDDNDFVITPAGKEWLAQNPVIETQSASADEPTPVASVPASPEPKFKEGDIVFVQNRFGKLDNTFQKVDRMEWDCYQQCWYYGIQGGTKILTLSDSDLTLISEDHPFYYTASRAIQRAAELAADNAQADVLRARFAKQALITYEQEKTRNQAFNAPVDVYAGDDHDSYETSVQ